MTTQQRSALNVTFTLFGMKMSSREAQFQIANTGTSNFTSSVWHFEYSKNDKYVFIASHSNVGIMCSVEDGSVIRTFVTLLFIFY